MKHIPFSLGVMTLAAPVSAQTITAQEFLDLYHGTRPGTPDRSSVTLYLKGLHEGFTWMNGALDASGRDLVFCAPGNLALGNDQILSLLEGYVDANAVFRDKPVGMSLMLTMQDAFPCS